MRSIASWPAPPVWSAPPGWACGSSPPRRWMTPAYPSRLPPMFDRIDHVGIAVPELEPALELWRDLMGLDVALREVVEEQGVEAVLLDVGDSHVELLAPLGPKTPVGKFLAKRGPGL